MSPFMNSVGSISCGQNDELLPNRIDRLAQEEPSGIWAEVPISPNDYTLGFKQITWASLASAVDGLAWYIESQLGRSTDFDTLAYVGPGDARYTVVLIACIKAGYKALLTSPRNSPEAHCSLFRKLSCTTMLTTNPKPPSVDSILQANPGMNLIQIPDLDKLLSTTHRPYPYDKSFDAACDEPILCLHTSGSTGLPKPLVYTHRFVTRMANLSQLPSPEQSDSLNDRIAGSRVICLLPPFHIAGFYTGTLMTVFNGNTVIYPSSASPPTGSSLAAILRQTPAEWAFVAPFQVESLSKDADDLKLVTERLSMLLYSGGSLPKTVGDLIASKLFLRNFLGSSEFGGFPQLMSKKPEDSLTEWNCTELHPYARAVFEPQETGYFELVIERDPIVADWQTIFAMFPDIDTYHTHDLFLPHPVKEGVWIHQSRADDIIVFLNGEKTNPVTFEQMVLKHPLVTAALVFGQQRFEAGLLIELVQHVHVQYNCQIIGQLLDEVWPTIEGANAVSPAHARVARSHVIFVDPKRPMFRSAKGTIQRQRTITFYDPDIAGLYDSVDASVVQQSDSSSLADNAGRAPPKVSSQDYPATAAQLDSIQASIFHALTKVVPEVSLTLTDDFFVSGLDSLQILRLARQLSTTLGLSRIDQALLYSKSSVTALALAIQKLLHQQKQGNGPGQSIAAQASDVPGIDRVFHRYAGYIDHLAGTSATATAGAVKSRKLAEGPMTVMLVGSTGSIGSYLLRELINSSAIGHIFCLNRGQASDARQAARNRSRDSTLPASFDPSIVTFLAANLDDHGGLLGLPEHVYQKLTSTVSLIVHCAWPVNFKQKLHSFEPQLAAVSHIALLSARCDHVAPVIFLSSVAAVLKLSSSVCSVLEAPVPVGDNVAFGGYGESKLVSEWLLRYATDRLGVETAIVRVGQIAAAQHSDGEWNTAEWIPHIIKSSKHVGAVPSSLGGKGERIDWLPVDVFATILLEMTLSVSRQSHGSDSDENPPVVKGQHHIFHAVNPKVTTWPALADTVAETLSSAHQRVEVVPVKEWLTALRASAFDTILEEGDADAVRSFYSVNPALMLEDFLIETMNSSKPLIMDTQQAIKSSQSLGRTTEIDKTQMARWITAIDNAK